MANVKLALQKAWKAVLAHRKLAIAAAVVAGAAVVGLAVVLLSGAEQGAGENKTAYTVTVTAETGKALENVSVYVYADAACTDLVDFVRTDANGAAVFHAAAGTCYAVLQEVPAGYAVADCYPVTGDLSICLEIQLLQEVPDDRVFKLGDVMFDFTVTTPEGTSYTLSRLLEEKKAVVINLWYTGCQPCRQEFPYLQEAYLEYSDQLEVLALDPVGEADARISQFRQDNGLSFPMAGVENAWVSRVGLVGYPTTMVIDRYGIISLIHVGSVTDTQTFRDIFAFFTDDAYTHSTVADVTELQGTAQGGQTASGNPTEVGGVSSYQVEVAPGQVVYTDVYRAFDMILSVESPNAYLVMGEEKYTPRQGVVSVGIDCEDTYSPVRVGVGNSGTRTETFTVNLTARPGSQAAPYTLSAGSVTVQIPAAEDQGIYYHYVAAEDGVLTLQYVSGTYGVEGFFTLYNLNTYDYRTLSEDSSDGKSLSVDVHAGDTVQVVFSTVPDSAFNYPAGTFTYQASFVKQDIGNDSDSGQSAVNKTYSVTVRDKDGKGVSGVTVSFGGTSAVTNSSGVASVTLAEGSYTATVTVPAGYVADKTRHSLTASAPSGTTVLTKVSMPEEYTELYVGVAYHVSTGSTATGLSSDGVTYFLFTPTQEGYYQISADNGAALKYYGNNTAFISDCSSGTDNYTGSSFCLNIKESHIGSSFILGATGADFCNLTITRTGASKKTVEDYPWTMYATTATLDSDFEAPGDLVMVDVTAADASSLKAVLGSDGYYHLNTADGPILYVDLKNSKLSVADAQSYGQVRWSRENADGTWTKVNYYYCVADYLAVADDGIYYLTQDWITILQDWGSASGWYEEGKAGYFFEDDTVDPDTAWMFLCCYVSA